MTDLQPSAEQQLGRAQDPKEWPRFVPGVHVGKLEPNFYCRGWNAKRKKYCRARAGAGTSHKGVGRCKHHDGAPIKHGRYSKVNQERLRDLLEELEDDPNPLDTIPEIQLERALLLDWINRYDEFVEILVAWNAAEHEEAKEQERRPRFREIPELQEAVPLIESISKAVARVEKARAENAVSRRDLFRITTEMGRVVRHHVDDEDALQEIKKQWLAIPLVL